MCSSAFPYDQDRNANLGRQEMLLPKILLLDFRERPLVVAGVLKMSD